MKRQVKTFAQYIIESAGQEKGEFVNEVSADQITIKVGKTRANINCGAQSIKALISTLERAAAKLATADGEVIVMVDGDEDMGPDLEVNGPGKFYSLDLSTCKTGKQVTARITAFVKKLRGSEKDIDNGEAVRLTLD